MMSFKKQLALITGASSGIGLEMSCLLAERQHNLLLVSRSGDKLEKLAAELIDKYGVEVHYFVVDLAEPGSSQQVLNFVQDSDMLIDILINNAGVGVFGHHTDLNINTLGEMMQLNIISVCELCLLFGKIMKQHRKGRILNVASTAAYQPTPYFASYGASKSYILNFSEALAKELEDFGVTVSCLCPGPTDTGFFKSIDEHKKSNNHFAKINRQNPEEVAATGIDMLFKGHLSKIVGTRNYLTAFSSRFAPRTMVASVAKKVMQPN